MKKRFQKFHNVNAGWVLLSILKEFDCHNKASVIELTDLLAAGPTNIKVCKDLIGEIRDHLSLMLAKSDLEMHQELIQQFINLCDLVKAFQCSYQFVNGEMREFEILKELHVILSTFDGLRTLSEEAKAIR